MSAVKMVPALEVARESVRDQAILNLRWHKQVSAFSKIYHGAISSLNGVNKNNIEQLIGRVMLFATTHAGLGNSSKLLFLINDLLLGRGCIAECPIGCYIDIYNHNDSHERIHVNHPHRLFLDPMTKAAIFHLKAKLANKSIRPFRNQESLFLQIKKQFGRTLGRPITRLASFCQAAVKFAACELYHDIPMYLTAFSIGKLPSYSSSTLSFQQLFGKQNSVPLSKPLSEGNSEIKERITYINPTIIDLEMDSAVSLNDTRHISSVLDRLRECCANEGEVKSCDLEDQISSLESYRDTLNNPAEIILAGWLIYVLKNERKLSTANRYLSAVGQYWLNSMSNLCVDELSQKEMDDIRESILEHSSHLKSAVFNYKVLNRLMQFSAEHHFTVLPTQPKGHKGDSPPVRNYLLSESSYRKAIHAVINDQTGGVQHNDTLCIALILMGRCGLRPGEVIKLKLKDIEPSNNYFAFIRPNEFGINKTVSAKRKIPLRLLLKPDELALFKDYYEKRQILKSNGVKNPLFLPPSLSNNFPYSLGAFDRYISQLLTAQCGTKVVSYHLRHMAISNVQLTVLGSKEHVQMLLPYSVSEANEIKVFFTTTSDRDACWNIASFAGHLDPRITFGVYMHHTDILLFQYIKAYNPSYSLQAWLNITGLSRHLLTRWSVADGATCKQVDAVLSHAYQKSQFPQSQHTSPIETPDQLKKSYISPTSKEAIVALGMLDDGVELVKISSVLNIKIEKIQTWYDRAMFYKDLKTSRGKPRLFPAKSKRMQPIEPASSGEISRGNTLISKLRKCYKESREELIQFVLYTLKNNSSGRSYILFSSLAEYKNYINFALRISEPGEWALEIDPPQKHPMAFLEWSRINRKITIKTSDNFTKNKNKFPAGRGRLYFLSTSELPTMQTNQRYSSNAIQYVCHVLAIMLDLDL